MKLSKKEQNDRNKFLKYLKKMSIPYFIQFTGKKILNLDEIDKSTVNINSREISENIKLDKKDTWAVPYKAIGLATTIAKALLTSREISKKNYTTLITKDGEEIIVLSSVTVYDFNGDIVWDYDWIKKGWS